MTIIEKHFEEKLSDKEIGEFIANFIELKGYANMDVIYDEKNEPLYIKFKIYEDQLNGWKLANNISDNYCRTINCNANLLLTPKEEESSARRT